MSAELQPDIPDVLALTGGELTDSDGLVALRCTVPDAWIDINDHMNAGYFAVAVHPLMDMALGMWGYGDERRRQLGRTMFAIEKHVGYFAELRRGEQFLLRIRLLDADEKRIIALFEFVRSDGRLACAIEMLMISVADDRRAASFDAATRERFAGLVGEHGRLPLPSQVTRRLTLRRAGVPREQGRGA